MTRIAASALAMLSLAICGCTSVAAQTPVEKDPLLSAVGIGVSDLAKSTDFYVTVMGMEKVRSYHLDYMDEELLRYPDGETYIVLMHWTDGSARSYKDLPVKVVTRTSDPAGLQAKIAAGGGSTVRAYAPSAQVGGAAVGLSKDPDGYVLEILPLRSAAPAPKPN
jgi:catechol 2,3-dioxygenase-like lactoylglutathione lyase family enzyme